MEKQKFAWTGFGVPVAWLMELDDVPATHGLADVFGDRYLCRHNAVFASIRNAAIGAGYSFSAEDTPLWRDYQSLSLVALHRILTSKTIPYLDTGTTFRRLLGSNPAIRLPPGFISANARRNYVFHEAAHCVAHSILEGTASDLRLLVPGESDRIVLQAVLTESFANTIEALGSVLRHMPVSDGVFFSLNSYLSLNQKRDDVLHRAGESVGATLRFVLLFLSYFEANLATAPPTDSTFERIAESAGGPFDQASLAREITDVGFGLNAGFRDSTTPTYFEMLGYGREFRSLANSAWLSRGSNRDFVRGLASCLHEAAGGA